MNSGNINTGEGTKLRRCGKDSVFCDLFSQPDYLFELYRSLHPEDVTATEDDLECVQRA